MVKKQEYGNNSILLLKGADRVRLKPSVIFGSDGLEGCQHSVFELLSNSIDEAKAGFGDRIEVEYDKATCVVSLRDYGRGIPLDYNETEKRYNWDLIFCELYAGGKMNLSKESSNYEDSLGTNGLGTAATQYASEFMKVEVIRDGFLYKKEFKKGKSYGKLIKEETKAKKTGTLITWKPDLEVFTDIEIPLEYFEDSLKRQAIVNDGVTITLKYKTEEETVERSYYYKNGSVDYINEINTGNKLSDVYMFQSEATGRDRADKPEYKVKMKAAFAFNNSESLIEYYHNSSWLEHGGSPEKAVKAAFVSAVDQYISKNNKYQKSESKVTAGDIFDSLILITSSYSGITSYENQTKKAINNKFIQEAMTEFLKHNLEVLFTENKEMANRVVDQILLNKRSRETSERAKINLKKKLSGGNDLTNRVQKFIDCRTKDLSMREIYIVEGDSALGSCKLGRDADFQAIIPVRGKILNCLKVDYDRILKSEIILDLIKVLGCGVEIKSKHNKKLNNFNLDELKWNKVIICTDSDVDGFQIRTLILAMFYRLMPTLIEKGKVFIAESPLYEITTKDKTYFAYSDAEKAKILGKLKEQKYTLQRSKGLGENEPEMMWETTMNPETRRLIQVMPEDAKNTQDVFDLLLGDNLQGRKNYIAEHGHLYLADVDVI